MGLQMVGGWSVAGHVLLDLGGQALLLAWRGGEAARRFVRSKYLACFLTLYHLVLMGYLTHPLFAEGREAVFTVIEDPDVTLVDEVVQMPWELSAVTTSFIIFGSLTFSWAGQRSSPGTRRPRRRVPGGGFLLGAALFGGMCFFIWEDVALGVWAVARAAHVWPKAAIVLTEVVFLLLVLRAERRLAVGSSEADSGERMSSKAASAERARRARARAAKS